MQYFDAHCHVQFDAYDADRDALIAQMKRDGVGGIVVGTDYAASVAAVELVQHHDHLWASVGLHPNHAFDEEFDMEQWRALAMSPKVVAIGECGLDNYRPGDVAGAKPKQRELLEKHIELALEVDKPLIIHARPAKGTMDAYEDLITLLTEKKQTVGDALRGDIHFFVGTARKLQELVALGCTVSYTAVVTFARDYDEAIRSVPLSALLSETDAPYVAPLSRRGQRNDPLSAKDVVEKLAAIRGEDPEMVRKTLLSNAERLFGLSLPG